MQFSIQQALASIGSGTDRTVLQKILEYLADTANTVALASAGLAINAGGATFAKIGATPFIATALGRYVSIAAGTAMPALTGLTITANRFNVACFFVNQAGTVSVRFGTEGATAGAVVFPDFPLGQALVGFLLITHSSTFTGGTTPLDTATTVYVSPLGSFDPSLLFT